MIIMPGIVNWDELWKATHFRGFHHHDPDLISYWDRKAELFNRRVMRHRERAEIQVASLGLRSYETVLDVGAGTGRLAIPMSKVASSVTALDQSGGMLACLKENMRADGIENIRCIQKSWQDLAVDEIEQHDVVISSNSLGVYELREALAKMDSLAKSRAYIFIFTDHKRDDGFSDFLRRDVAVKNAPGPADYLVIYNLLAEMGIYADIEMVDWLYKERYSSLDEAASEWMQMHDIAADKEPDLREFLSLRLVDDESGVCMVRHYKSATISWRKGKLVRD